MRTRQVLYSFLAMLTSFPALLLHAQENWYTSLHQDTFFRHVELVRFTAPERAIAMLDDALEKALLTDTVKAIQIILRRAHFTGHMANYKESYDFLWQALALAEQANLPVAKSATCISLGRYYSYYQRREKALAYLDTALKIHHQLVSDGSLPDQVLSEDYYVRAETMRIWESYDLARIYLDSAYHYCCLPETPLHKTYLEFEKAILLKQEGNLSEAIKIFQSIQPWLQKNDPGYLVLVHAYLGDTYRALEKFEVSQGHYLMGLEAVRDHQAHIDFSPLIHQKLADLYLDREDLTSALEQLQIAKRLDEEFFDSRSENNRPLLEIQDAYREAILSTQRLRQEQKITELEHRTQVWLLQRIILFVSLLSFMILGFVFFKYIRSKHRAEKRLLRKERELEIQKANELVELKNKELATSTLKLIEKDELLVNLRDKLNNRQGSLDAREVKQIVRAIRTDTLQNWEEFEARFTAVNRDFYQRLRRAFPKLTQGDHKVCALIKLNFSSKEMAKLLGISVESVHTTRYRLRKKLQLGRQDNLGEFIANL